MADLEVAFGSLLPPPKPPPQPHAAVVVASLYGPHFESLFSYEVHEVYLDQLRGTHFVLTHPERARQPVFIRPEDDGRIVSVPGMSGSACKWRVSFRGADAPRAPPQE